MKKVLLTMAVLVGMTAGTMVLSAFTTPKQDKKAENSQIQMNDGNWELYREKVPYCNGDTDYCVGYGNVWKNTETYQLAITFADRQPSQYEIFFTLSEYTGKEGYNYRFWYSLRGETSTYYYVKI